MAQRRRTAAERQRLSRRQARLVGLAGFTCAAALPPILWHEPMAAIASDFEWELDYLVTGWTGYSLIALGLLFFVPVLISIGRSPGSRLYPRSRNAYVGWGTVLYMLGIGLASQVAAVTRVHPL
jgi:hypothetical protein